MRDGLDVLPNIPQLPEVKFFPMYGLRNVPLPVEAKVWPVDYDIDVTKIKCTSTCMHQVAFIQ